MNKLVYSIGFACVLLCSSCNDWLSVTPEGQTEAEDLYETDRGCNSALGGIYYTLTNKSLYGKELSYGMMDALAQYWNVDKDIKHNYYYDTQYDYTNSLVKGRMDAIWNQMYQAVTACNAFIHYINPDKVLNADLMIGEAYALRAFCHMELFELYGPVIKTKADLQKKAIAYRTEFNVTSKNFDTGETVLAMAEADLQNALEYLKNDPIKNPQIGRRGDSNTSILTYHEVLNQRGNRMNYYCALGLLARLEMLRKDYDKANSYALRVIEEAKDVIRLIDKTNLEAPNEASKDYPFCTEMLGAFYLNELYSDAGNIFNMNDKVASASNGYPIDNDRWTFLSKNIYIREPDGSGLDDRLRYWFKSSELGSENPIYDFTKFKEAIALNKQTSYDPVFPIMRMSEIYYILSESSIGKDPQNEQALEYLNQVRRTRNLEDIKGPLSDEVMLEYIVRDARKDFIGEGRIFLMYKRLFYSIYVSAEKTVAPTDAMFVFLIPDNEYEFTGQEKK